MYFASDGLTDAYADCQSGDIDSLYWDGDTGEIDLKNGTQAYLSAYNCSDPSSEPVFTSYYFNLAERAAIDGAPVTDTSAATSTTSSATTTPIATNTTSPIITSHSSPATLTTLAAGIAGGIGGGVVGAVVIVALAFALPRTRRKRNKRYQLQDNIVPGP